MKTHIISGMIWAGQSGEDYDALLVGYNTEAFAERFQDIIGYGKKKVTVRYWISDTEKTKTELVEDTIRTISGSAEACYSHRYSELTGYLWTDAATKVGGHDLLRELEGEKGKFLYMEIDL